MSECVARVASDAKNELRDACTFGASATCSQHQPLERAVAAPTLDPEEVRGNLIASGLWTTLRTRPFSRIPEPGASPAAIFVTAIDTNPLAIDPAFFIEKDPEAFDNGLKVLSRIAECPIYLCTAPDSGIECPHPEQYHHLEFDGPHPAGLVGTHIHFVMPVGKTRTVWHIGYQHVTAIGRLFTTGRLPTERLITLCGPMALRPRVLRTRIGASTVELLRGETAPGNLRVISGSALSGHRAAGPLAARRHRDRPGRVAAGR
mgnify:CR=1 FL=1